MTCAWLTYILLTATSCAQDLITHTLESAGADVRDARADSSESDQGGLDEDMEFDATAYALGSAVDVDADVYTSVFSNGTTWEGHPAGTFMHVTSNRPQPWAIATVHASMLLRRAGMDVSPNEVLAYALRATRLRCEEDGQDGCFGISAQRYTGLLQRDFPERFGSVSFDDAVAGERYPSAALAFAYLGAHTIATLQLYDEDPLGALKRAPDEDAVFKALSLSARFSPFEAEKWERVFGGCAGALELCFTEGSDLFREDFIRAAVAYTRALGESEPFDTRMTLGDMDAYMTTIQALYDPDDVLAARERLRAEHGAITDERGQVRFARDVTRLLESILPILGRPTIDEVTGALCARGQLGDSPPCP